MGALDRAKAHFADFGVQSLEVPEWGEPGDAVNPPRPLVIYWRPMTLDEKQRLHSIGERDGYLARLADCLVMKALDAEGKKLFTIEDKRALRHQVDPDVLARVVARMMAAPEAKELGKS